MRRTSIKRRWIVVAASVILLLAGALALVIRLAGRAMLHSLAANNAEMRRLNLQYEARLRDELDRLQRLSPEDPATQPIVDRIFAMLDFSFVARRSREVRTWENARHCPERTAVARKWAGVAADEASYEAALCARWGADYQRGLLPHHVTNEELPPIRMPVGWTDADLIGPERIR